MPKVTQFSSVQSGATSRPFGLAPSRWLELLFLLLLPILTFFCFNLRPLHQAGSLDPYFYTGYINNLDDLLRRFDLLYYSVRFGLILPGRFFSWALGPEHGYFAFRYVLTLVAGIPLYTFAKRTFNPPVAVLIYFGLLVSPWFGWTLLWDHPDASGVPYLMAAMCLLLLSTKPSWRRDGLAGCCASLAMNSNIFTGAIFAIFGTVYAVAALLYGTDWRTAAKRAGMFTAGFVLVLGCGYIYYWNFFGKPRDIFAPTFKLVNFLNAGGMKTYRIPGFGWLVPQYHVFVPVFASLFCLITGIRRCVRFEVAVCAVSGTGIIAFFFVHQFLMGGDTLQLFYYFSYALPSTFLMVACIFNELWERYTWRSGAFLAAGMAATGLPAVMVASGAYVAEQFNALSWVGIAAPTAVLAVLSRVHWRSRRLRIGLASAALIGFGFSISAGFGHNYPLARRINLLDDNDIKVYRVSLQLIDAAPKLKDGGGNLVFWYNSLTNNPINSVQCTYLWSYSKLNQYLPLDPGMPHLGPYQMKALRNPNLRYLALLGRSPAEVEEGLRALTEARVGYDTVDTRDLNSGTFHVYYRLLQLTTRPLDPAEAGSK